MKHTVAKNTLSFMTSKTYRCIRTPQDIWERICRKLSEHGLQFTLDVCASDINHLLPRYYTSEDSCLNHDWTGEIVYCHPMFDMHIGKFVEKAATSKCITVMLLPAAVHTRYFHRFIWDKEQGRARSGVSVDFLEKPTKGFNFGHEDGTVEELKDGKVGYIKSLMIVYFNLPNPIPNREVPCN